MMSLINSTFWRSPIVRSLILADGLTCRLYLSETASICRLKARRLRIIPWSGRNNATFSVTVRAGIRAKFWKTIPTPRARLSRGDWIWASSPLNKMVPSSGRFTP